MNQDSHEPGEVATPAPPTSESDIPCGMAIAGPRRAPAPTTLDDLWTDYGIEFTSASDLMAKITSAPDWRAVDRLRFAISELLTVEPPVLLQSEGETLLREVNVRLDVPVLGSADDWRALNARQRRVVWDAFTQIQAGHQSLGRPPDMHRTVVLNEVDSGFGGALPEATRDVLVSMLEHSLAGLPSEPCIVTPAPPEEAAPTGSPSRSSVPVKSKHKQSIVVGNRLVPWPDFVRAVPNCLVRGGLWRPTKSRGGYLRKGSRIPTVAGIEMCGHGPMLTESDLDVFAAAVHLSRRSAAGEMVSVTLAEFIKATGRRDGTKTRSLVKAALRRLARFHLDLTYTRETLHVEFSGTLLAHVSAHRSRSSRCHVVAFAVPTGLLALFSSGTTYFTLAERLTTIEHPVAAWLQAFFSSHTGPIHDMFISTYLELTGLQCSPGEFRTLIEFALKKLMSRGFLKSYEIADDCKVKVKVRSRT